MVLDLLFVLLCLGVFLLLSLRHKNFLYYFAQNAFAAGLIVTVIQMIILLSKLEVLLVKSEELSQISLIPFVTMFLIRFRPLLFGILLSLGGKFTEKIFFQKNMQEKNEKVDCNNELAEKVKMLSRRELEVARLGAKGYTNAQIAQELYISVDTVKKHMYVIFEKLGIESRKDLKRFFGD